MSVFVNKKIKNRNCRLKHRLEAYYTNSKMTTCFLKRYSLGKYSSREVKTGKKDFSDIGIRHPIFLKRPKVFYFFYAFFIFLKTDEFFLSLEKKHKWKEKQFLLFLISFFRGQNKKWEIRRRKSDNEFHSKHCNFPSNVQDSVDHKSGLCDAVFIGIREGAKS